MLRRKRKLGRAEYWGRMYVTLDGEGLTGQVTGRTERRDREDTLESGGEFSRQGNGKEQRSQGQGALAAFEDQVVEEVE